MYFSMRNTGREEIWVENVFKLRHVEFQLSVPYLSRDVEQSIGYVHLDVRILVWAGSICWELSGYKWYVTHRSG